METQTVLFEVAKPPPSGVYVTVHSVWMCVWCDHTCTAKIIGLKKKRVTLLPVPQNVFEK